METDEAKIFFFLTLHNFNVLRLFDYIEHKNHHDIETLEQLELDSETGRSFYS